MREVKARWMMVLGSVLILSGAIWLLNDCSKTALNKEISARNISEAQLKLRVAGVEKTVKHNTALATANSEALKQKASKADLNKLVKRVVILEEELKSLQEDVDSLITTIKTNADAIAKYAEAIDGVINEVAAHRLRLDKLEADVVVMKDCLGSCCGQKKSCSKYKPKPKRKPRHRKPKNGNGVTSGGTHSECHCTGQPNCKCNSKPLARGGNKKKLKRKRKSPVHVVLMEEVVEETTIDGTTP